MLNYAYADESGDTGYRFEASSSPRFVLSMIAPEQEEAFVDCLLGLRRSLHKPAAFEFHFRQNDDRVRAAFFDAIMPLRFDVLIATIDKRKAPADFRRRGKAGLYAHALAGLALRAPVPLRNCKLYLDGSGGQTHFLQELKASVRYACRVAGRPDQNFRDIRLLESSNPLIQCADMIAGAAADSAEKGHSMWRERFAVNVVADWHEDFAE
jgi:hypothetical protein